MADGMDQSAPSADDLFLQGQRLLSQKAFEEAELALRQAAGIASTESNEQLLVKIGSFMEQLCAYDVMWVGYSTIKDPQISGLPDWNGEPLQNKNLLVHRRRRHVGAEIRMGRLAELAARQGCNVTAIVDRRLLPIFYRSFPSCRFIGADQSINTNNFDMLAGYDTLGQHLTPTAQSVADQFLPLIPDRFIVEELRDRYKNLADRERLVGVSWYSQKQNKNMPSLADWAWLFRNLDGTIVSVNYGDRSEEIAQLVAQSGVTILPNMVDQMASLEHLAAQICAVDTFISVSNTSAHMAGSLGIPAHLMLTEFLRMTWPIEAQHSPWYPHLAIHRLRERSWKETFESVAPLLNSSQPF